nr:hypothetical protein [uncultured Desulfobacter sp.]
MKIVCCRYPDLRAQIKIRVAESAGLSRGICNDHFHTKEQLLLDSFMTVYREHETAWKKAPIV